MLKLAKNQASAKQHPEAELLPFDNYSHSSFTLSSEIGHVQKIQKRACTAQKINFSIKACVRYFLRNVYSSPNDSPSKTMKDVFYFI